MDHSKSNILGMCKVCSFIFDPTIVGGCPACRMARVQTMFRPVDTVRTFLAINNDDDVEEKDLNEEFFWHGKKAFYRPTQSRSEDDPRGFKIPLDAAGQIYELRRMFRL